MEAPWPARAREHETANFLTLPRSGITACDPPVHRGELAFKGEALDKAARQEWPFSDAAFTSDGRRIAAVAMNTVVIWDAATAAQIDYFNRQSSSSGDRLAPSPDERRLAVAVTQPLGNVQVIDITPPPPQ